MKPLILLLIIAVLSACSAKENTNQGQTSDGAISLAETEAALQDGSTTFKTYCAGCHGSNLGGGSAGPLLKESWAYGFTRGLMIRNVKFGIPGTEMAAFRQILEDEQIRNVVDYLRSLQTRPPDDKPEIPSELQTETYTLAIDQLGKYQLKTPWAIEFVDQHTALISERDGQLKWMINEVIDTQVIAGTPIPHTASSTGGYMDIALDPNYSTNKWIYLAYSHTDGDPKDNAAPAMTKIIRGKIKAHQWVEEQVLFEAPESLRVVKGNRWGCRFLFDADGHLYFTIGDMAQAMDAQDLGKVTGKVFRIHPDGSIPVDNPFVGQAGALEAIYSIGNRNVQGLAVHPLTGDLWASEHGPMGGDELNILQAGANYGWPIITYGLDYSGDTVSTKTHQEGMEQPIHQWTPSTGVCPIAFIESPLFPKWENKLLVGSLAFQDLRLLDIDERTVKKSEIIMTGLGRVREIKTAPDGSIFVVLNGPDVLLRLRPAQTLLQ